MAISIQDVEHVADLARIHIEDDQKEQYATQLSNIFSYIDQLQEVDTSSVEETCQVTGLEDVVREDVVKDADEAQKKVIRDQFPQKSGNLLVVPEIFSKK